MTRNMPLTGHPSSVGEISLKRHPRNGQQWRRSPGHRLSSPHACSEASKSRQHTHQLSTALRSKKNKKRLAGPQLQALLIVFSPQLPTIVL